jgi:hypothetical protein
MNAETKLRSNSWWIVCGAGAVLLIVSLLLMWSNSARESKAERLFKRFVFPQIPSSVTKLEQEGFVGFNDVFLCFKFQINTNDQRTIVEQLGFGRGAQAEESELRSRFEQINKGYPESKMSMPTNLADRWVEYRIEEERISKFLYYREGDGLVILFLYGR